jgi:ATP-binding protein involved in chromosome partitioning
MLSSHSSSSDKQPTRDDILAALARLRDPAGGDMVSNGRISGVAIRAGGQVGFLIAIAPEEEEAFRAIRQQAEDAVAQLAGVKKVIAVLTAQRTGEDAPVVQEAAKEPARRAVWNHAPIPGVGKVIAVASGKGGVGKSSVTMLLAHALADEGVRVGVVDADIHGPSVARMLGISGKQPEAKDGLMQPVVGHGIPALSMGQLAGEAEALVWRGPQLTKMLNQLLRGADWQSCYDGAGLDVLLVDMPPGTGDVQLTLAQNVPLSGVVLVTIPSAVAVMDAAKSATMFGKVNVKLLGVVENMAGIEQPDGSLMPVFGSGGGAELATQFNVPLLAQLPLWPTLAPKLDAGEKPDSVYFQALLPVALALNN